MPRVPDLPCSVCGKLLWRNPYTSLADPICQDCRRNARMRPCAQCGAPFDGKKEVVRCSECRATPRPKVERTKECVICGITVQVNRGNRKSKTCGASTCHQTFASMRREEWRDSLPDSVCVDCASPYRPQVVWQVRCVECATTPAARYCIRCDDQIQDFGIKYCSDTCATEAAVERAGQRINDLYAMACRIGIEGWGWRSRLYGLLIERDGQDCWLCGDLVDVDLPSGPRGCDDGPSVDHVIPRSLGGPDDIDNLRLAHWGCNRNRGNRMEVA